MLIACPLILDEFFNISGRSVQWSVARETDLLGKCAVLPQQLDGVGKAVARIRPVCHVRANFQLMPPEPLFRRKLKCWICFELIGSPGPGVKEIPAPAFRIDQHIRRSLAMGT